VNRELLEQAEAEHPRTALPAAPALEAVPALGAGLDPRSVMALQRTAGNAAVGAYLKRATLHRCGDGNCGCADCSKHEHEEEPELAGDELMARNLRKAARMRAEQGVPGGATSTRTPAQGRPPRRPRPASTKRRRRAAPRPRRNPRRPGSLQYPGKSSSGSRAARPRGKG
jgi:hypothetical protein